jgi:hypothetical protein
MCGAGWGGGRGELGRARLVVRAWVRKATYSLGRGSVRAARKSPEPVGWRCAAVQCTLDKCVLCLTGGWATAPKLRIVFSPVFDGFSGDGGEHRRFLLGRVAYKLCEWSSTEKADFPDKLICIGDIVIWCLGALCFFLPTSETRIS